MPDLVVDTHTIVWYLGGDPRLSARAEALLDSFVESGDWIWVPSVCPG